MYIFLSYAAEQVRVAKDVAGALTDEDHDVFIDRGALQAGFSFHQTIRESVRRSDAFVCLVSQEAIQPGSYVLSEVQFAERRWPRPSGFVLPVIIPPIETGLVPAYLRRTTWITPQGNVAAEVAAAVEALNAPDKLAPQEQRRWTETAIAGLRQTEVATSWVSALTTLFSAVVTLLLAVALAAGGRPSWEAIVLAACLLAALGAWMYARWIESNDRRDRLRALELFAQLKRPDQQVDPEQSLVVQRAFKRWHSRLA